MRVAFGLIALICCGVLFSGGVHATTQSVVEDRSAPADDVRTLETVVVSGIRPGPGLWKVSHGERVLWILGTVSPVPKKMQWYSPRSEAVLRQAKEIIGAPQVGVQFGLGSAFKAAFAIPTILRARQLPDGKSLRDVLPADLYARWLLSKKSYLGEDRSVEHWRPMFAAEKLYQAALDDAGLQSGTGTSKRIEKLAGSYRIKQTSSTISYDITDPKAVAKSFAKSQIDEVACFRSQLDRLDRDVADAARRANAWATGDMAELIRLSRNDRSDACRKTFEQLQVVQSLGLQHANARARASWLATVDSALRANDVSFSSLPMRELLEDDGLLAELRRKGYQVEAPE